MQAEKALQVNGIWHRWSRYEVVNGAVSPAKDADFMKFDPWFAYRQNSDKYRTVEQPYCALLELGRKLENERARGVLPSKPNLGSPTPKLGPQNDSDNVILQWCNEYGPLGLVPVLSSEIRLGHAEYHYREGGKWFTYFEGRDQERRFSTTTRPQIESGEKDSVTRPVDGRRPEQRITWLSDSVHEYERTALSEKRVFFDPWYCSEGFSPWRPGSIAFWRVYAEPVQEIAYWCRVFTNAVNWLSGSTRRDDFFKESFRIIKNLAESVTPSFELYPTRTVVLDEARISPGLLASYALMFAWDLVEERCVIQCKRCDRYFVSDEHRARYCSPRCRSTAQSRRYRANKKTKS